MMPATMLVMVVADAEPVRVAHIRGSPAACMCVCVAAAETADVLLTGGLQASSVAHATGLHCGSGRSCPQLAAGDIARS